MAEEEKTSTINNDEADSSIPQKTEEKEKSGNDEIIDYTNEDFIKALIDAVNEDNLILFIGSGISKLCGAPLWNELADTMLTECTKDEKYGFDCHKKEILLSRVKDERELISIAQNIMKKATDNDDAFLDVLKRELKADENRRETTEHLKSVLCRISRHIVTTNADKIFDDTASPDNVLWNVKRFNRHSFTHSRDVIHIHGSVEDFSSLVFTTPQYLKRYAGREFEGSVKQWFTNPRYTILFLGYGFREIQLLDFLVNTEEDKRNERRFILNGYYDEEKYIFDAEREYYDGYHVELISFSKNEKGYNGLLTALDYIEKKIDEAPMRMPNNIDYVDEITSKWPSDELLKELLIEYPSWNYKEKGYFLDAVEDSKRANSWVKRMIMNDDVRPMVFKDPLEQFGPKSLDILWRTVSLLASTNAYSPATAPFYKEYLQKVILQYIDKSVPPDDSGYPNALFKILLSRRELMKLEGIFDAFGKYVKDYGESGYSSWLAVLDSQYRFVTRLPKSTLKELFDFALYWAKQFKGQSPFHLFYETYGDFLDSSIPDHLVEKLLRTIEMPPYDRYGEYAFETLKDGFQEFPAVLWRWLASACRSLSDDSAISFFEKFRKSWLSVYRQTALYIANTHFNVLRGQLFDHLDDFKSRECAPELYSALNSNADFFTEEEGKRLLAFAERVECESHADTKFAIADLLKLLCRAFPENDEYKVKSTKLQLSFSEDEKNEYEKEHDPLRARKKTRIKTIEKLYEDALNGPDSLSLDDFLKCFDDDIPRANKPLGLRGMDRYFDRFIEKFDLFDNLDKILVKPETRYPSLIDALERSIFVKKMEPDEFYLTILKLEDYRDEERIGNIAISALFHSRGLVSGLSKDVRKKTYEFLINHEYWENAPDRNIFSNKINLYTSNAWKWYLAIIALYPGDEEERFLPCLEKGIVEEPLYAKAAMARSLSNLWKCEKEWTTDNLSVIFDNTEDGFNYSYSSYASLAFGKTDLLEALTEKKILLPLLMSVEGDNVRFMLSRYIVREFMDGEISKDVLKTLAKTNFYGAGLYDFLHHWYYYDKTIGEFMGRLNEMLELFSESTASSPELTGCGILLLKMFANSKDENFDTVAHFIQNKAFAQNLDSSDHYELVILFENNRDLPQWCHDCLYEYLAHLGYCDVPIDDRAKLFILLKASKEKKQKLVNILVHAQPAIAKLLK